MNKQTATKTPNLYLVGFMGTGKSVVGRRVADLLSYTFLDSDHEIEAGQGRSIPAIFKDSGEAAFREMERRFIESGHPDAGCVVSCGGGLVVQPGMLDLLRQKGIVICLYASPETVLKRTASNSNRPLLQGENPERRIRQLMESRENVYRNAGTLITTDMRPLADIVQHVKRVYTEGLRNWNPEWK